MRAVLALTVGGAGLEYATTSRADAPLIGCAVAVLLHGDVRRVPRWASWAAFLGLAGAFLVVPAHSSVLELGGFTVVALLAGLLLASVVVDERSMPARVLDLPPLVYVGRISYGLYLFHWPILMAVRELVAGTLTQVAIGYTATTAVTLASFYLVERPALRLKSRFTRAAAGTPRASDALRGRRDDRVRDA